MKLHYHICIQMDVLSKHVPKLVQYLVGQTTHLVGHCPMFYRYFPHCTLLITSIHGPSFVRARYCSVEIGLWTRHVQSLLQGPGRAE